MSRLRVMTWNIRAGLGLDRRRSLVRLARVIRDSGADVVALQEVDRGRDRSEGVDQAAWLGARLGMYHLVGPSIEDEEGGAYGNAVLARHPLELVRHDQLPTPRRAEPRTAFRVRIADPLGGPIDLLTTHLGLGEAERRAQARALLEEWIAGREIDPGVPLVLAGDLNGTPGSVTLRMLRERLHDAAERAGAAWRATWPTRWPLRRLDHLLVSRHFDVETCDVIRSLRARVASDHFPVIADLLRRRDA